MTEQVEKNAQDSTEVHEKTYEEILAALQKYWEEYGAKTIIVNQDEPVFDGKEFIESLSYSNSKTLSRTLRT